MDFIEVLFVLLFIVLPILEGVFRKNRKKQPPLQRTEPRERPVPGRESAGGWGDDDAEPTGVTLADSGEREDRPAADMVPDDLWTVLTGERRPRPGPVEAERGGVAVESEVEEGWSAETDWLGEAEPEELEPGSWRSPIEETEVGTEPESLEYVGPEAYSLEGPLPSPEARHRAFHRVIDEPLRPVPRQPSRVVRGLLQPGGLRQAVIMSEILGSPKGLEAQ